MFFVPMIEKNLLLLVQEYAHIVDNMCSLKIGNTEVLNNPDDPNNVDSTKIIWTKETGWETAESEWNSLYKMTAPKHISYVHNFRVGIVHAKTTLRYISGNGM